MKNKLILLESNFSYMLSLLDISNINECRKIVIRSKTNKTTNLRLFSFFVFKEIKTKSKILNFILRNIFFILKNILLLLFYSYMQILLIIYNRIDTIYTSVHTLSGRLLLEVIKKKKNKKYKVIIVDDGTLFHTEEFHNTSAMKKCRNLIDSFLLFKDCKYAIGNKRIINIYYEFSRLNNDKKKMINHIFMYKDEGIKIIENLLVTQPLYLDGYMKSMKEQNKLYEYITENIKDHNSIYIKMHPREKRKLKSFKDYKYLSRHTPLELYIMNGLIIKNIYTINSTITLSINNNFTNVHSYSDIWDSLKNHSK